MKTFLFLLLSSTCFAGNLDLPGTFSAAYDYRLNNSSFESDNRKGRWIVHGEQAFSTKRLSADVQGYVGYELYDPNFDPLNNYGILGIRNKSLLNPFILAFEYQKPFTQTADQVNRFTVQVSYQKDWNLAK